ncbi:bacterial Ig-like domain-containing protein [Oceanirhabdus seepicola]|uniref:Bacterial Ig-like domain-containing protein n=1 Tax=Oceanirhabdus seepicola TaxID=2828781 RepID=A0A9J6NXK3_9CLOT|nr:bacterial Ig-like domain-containing protein [Oceanirhabdus seepicola]MCM1988357.1 bacterial Ig-like domain-containing protein [Oceanirhabdus seepicola]
MKRKRFKSCMSLIITFVFILTLVPYQNVFAEELAEVEQIQSAAPLEDNISVTNNSAADDTVEAIELTEAEIVKVKDAEMFTVSFEVDGGSSVDSQSVVYNGKVIQPAKPSKEGYIFDGWYVDNKYETGFDFENTVITEDTTIYAKWEKDESELTEVEQIQSAAPLKENIIITNNSDADDTVEVTGIMEGCSVKVYDAASGGNLLETAVAVKIETTTSASISIPQLGKDTGKVYISVTSTDKSESKRIEKSYDAERYNVSFEVDGGSSVESQTVTYNEKASRSEEISKEGYIFNGWYVDNKYETGFDFENTVITEDTTIYAKWEKDESELTTLNTESTDNWQNYASDSFAGGDGSVDDPYQIATAEELAHLADSVNEGKEPAKKYYKLTDDINLEAHEWVPIGKDFNNSFKGYFDGNGKQINNLWIGTDSKPNSEYDNVGLFGLIKSATIKNVGVSVNINCYNKKIKGSGMGTYDGGLVGVSYFSYISNSYVEGDVTNSNVMEIGGLVGTSIGSKIRNSYATVDLTGGEESKLGGFAGSRSDCTFINVYYNSNAAQIVNGSQGVSKKGAGDDDYGITALTEMEMKALAGTEGDLVDKLNERDGIEWDITEREEWACSDWKEWAIIDGKNYGFPTFKDIELVPILDSIAITTPATKQSYKVGEELDITGMVVTGTYSDGNKQGETITEDNITGFDSSAVASSQTLTVTINGKTATFTITVDKADGPALTGVTSDDAANTITGMTDDMEFSTDGENWTRYSTEISNLPDLTGNVELQVRIAETATHKAGQETTFGFTGQMVLDVSIDNVVITSSGDYTIIGNTKVNTIKVDPNVMEANITLDNVNVDVSETNDACAFDIGDGASVNITLKEGRTNTFKSGSTKAGIKVETPVGGTAGSLIIDGTGNLIAIGGRNYENSGPGAGIGGNGRKDEEGIAITPASGNITINSGNIEATGGDGDYYTGAGIGGGAAVNDGSTGAYKKGYAGNGGSTTIHGGNVTAIGGSTSYRFSGAGIGGGSGYYSGIAGEVLIDGGVVNAKSGNGKFVSSAIGAGYSNVRDRIETSHIIIEGTAVVNTSTPDSIKWSSPNIGSYRNTQITIGGSATIKAVAGTRKYSKAYGEIFCDTLKITGTPKITVLSVNKIGDKQVGKDVVPIYANTITSSVPIISGIFSEPLSTTSSTDVKIVGGNTTNTQMVSLPANYASFAKTVESEGSYIGTIENNVLQEIETLNHNFNLTKGLKNYNVKVVPVLNSIAITTPATKLVYKVGESLDISGMIVTGSYSDGTTKVETITEGNVTGFDSSVAVESQTLTVTVNGKTMTYEISVDKAEGPAVTGVTSDDAANTITGMTRDMEFSSDGENWTRYNTEMSLLPDLTGNVALQVRFAGTATHTAGPATTFNFTVETLNGIEITTLPTKLSYKVGDDLDISGMVVTGSYSDGTTKIETISEGNVTGFDSSAVASTQTLTVTINRKTATITISVDKAAGPALIGVISDDTANTITGMTRDMEFSIDGVNWEYYSTEISILPDLTGRVALQVRIAETATHKAGPATTFNFTVETLNSIEITTLPTKLSYKVGDDLDISGMVVKGSYSDGTTKIETISEGNVTGFDSSAVASSQRLTVTINGKTATFTISVDKADGPAVTGVTSDDAANTITGITRNMEFSIDGVNWEYYSTEISNLPDLTGRVALQVRIAETATHKAGPATTFNFTVTKRPEDRDDWYRPTHDDNSNNDSSKKKEIAKKKKATKKLNKSVDRVNITVNEGSRITNNQEVTLHLEDTGLKSANVKYMMISNTGDFKDAKWVKYSPDMKWLLDEGNGIKNVFIKFKDKDDNISEIINFKVILETDEKLVDNKNQTDKEEAKSTGDTLIFTKESGYEYTEGQWTNEYVEFDFHDTVEATVNDYSYSLDGGKTWKSSKHGEITEEGIIIVKYKTVDKEGNNVLNEAIIKVDKTPPVGDFTWDF